MQTQAVVTNRQTGVLARLEAARGVKLTALAVVTGALAAIRECRTPTDNGHPESPARRQKADAVAEMFAAIKECRAAEKSLVSGRLEGRDGLHKAEARLAAALDSVTAQGGVA